MTTINSYLTFNGNCREAMRFYQQCLGGALSFQTIGESPLSEKMPEQMRDCILHAVLVKDQLVLMATDMVGCKGLLHGNAVSLMLQCSGEAEIKECYERLSRDGQKTHPLELTFWGAILGGITDKYGHHWLLYYPAATAANINA